jgi:hypothetical protein
MKATFHKLNEGWNADPNVPSLAIEIRGDDIVLKFLVNPFRFTEFEKDEIGVLSFVRCERYRLGPPNDEGWYLGQCKFSKLAPQWGDFYLVQGDGALLDAPEDWKTGDAFSLTAVLEDISCFTSVTTPSSASPSDASLNHLGTIRSSDRARCLPGRWNNYLSPRTSRDAQTKCRQSRIFGNLPELVELGRPFRTRFHRPRGRD